MFIITPYIYLMLFDANFVLSDPTNETSRSMEPLALTKKTTLYLCAFSIFWMNIWETLETLKEKEKKVVRWEDTDHAPETRIGDANSMRWMTENIHTQCNFVSIKARATIGWDLYGWLISHHCPRIYVWGNSWASFFEASVSNKLSP